MEETQYRDLLLSLRNTLQKSDATKIPIEADDERLNKAVGSQTREQDEEYDNRNKLYTHLLEMYISNYHKKEKIKCIYKGIFFTVTIILFAGIVICGLIGIIKLSLLGDGNLANVGVAITNIAGIISALIILPKIIAEHLFPVDEESNMLEMVKGMQDNDAKIRDIIYDGKESKV